MTFSTTPLSINGIQHKFKVEHLALSTLGKTLSIIKPRVSVNLEIMTLSINDNQHKWHPA